MKRIAIIEDGYVRDTQVFTANPDTIDKNPDWENNFGDVKYPCLYVGVHKGKSEAEIRNNVATTLGIHPDIISLVVI